MSGRETHQEVHHGDTPYAIAEQSLRLYAKEILPMIQKRDAAPKIADAAK